LSTASTERAAPALNSVRVASSLPPLALALALTLALALLFERSCEVRSSALNLESENDWFEGIVQIYDEKDGTLILYDDGDDEVLANDDEGEN
tara:strand:- start:193 stop:471 length:279 start_codon:yes stop_codon:yes gene_type:complete